MAKRTDITKLKFRFNTAITGVNDGKRDEKAHTQTIMPLRASLMNIDGATGCYIYRYDMMVEFDPTIIGMNRLARTVRECVQQFAATAPNGFPLRGKKTPRAIWERPKARKASNMPSWIVVADFDSDLYSHAIPQDDIKDFLERTRLSLMHTDGARDAAVGPRQMCIRVLNDPAAIAAARDHLSLMVQNTMDLVYGSDGSRLLDDDRLTFPFVDTLPNVRFWDRGSGTFI